MGDTAASEANSIARSAVRVAKVAAIISAAGVLLAGLPLLVTELRADEAAEERSEWIPVILESRAVVSRDRERDSSDPSGCRKRGFDFDAAPTDGGWVAHTAFDAAAGSLDFGWSSCSPGATDAAQWPGVWLTPFLATAAAALPAGTEPSPDECHRVATAATSKADWLIDDGLGDDPPVGSVLCLLSNLGGLVELRLVDVQADQYAFWHVIVSISIWTRTGGGPAPTAAPEPS
ncbi:MAG TPA: hypothetical protein VGF17_12540 [Phytomonospora sp.]